MLSSKLAFQPAAGPGPFAACQGPGGMAYHHLKAPAAAYSVNGIGLHASPGVDLLHPGYPGKSLSFARERGGLRSQQKWGGLAGRGEGGGGKADYGFDGCRPVIVAFPRPRIRVNSLGIRKRARGAPFRRRGISEPRQPASRRRSPRRPARLLVSSELRVGVLFLYPRRSPADTAGEIS